MIQICHQARGIVPAHLLRCTSSTNWRRWLPRGTMLPRSLHSPYIVAHNPEAGAKQLCTSTSTSTSTCTTVDGKVMFAGNSAALYLLGDIKVVHLSSLASVQVVAWNCLEAVAGGSVPS